MKKIMKTLICIVLVCSLSVVVCNSIYAAGSLATVTASEINIRSGPSLSKKVVTCLTKGTDVRILSSRSDGWCKVSYGKITGYANKSYLKFQSTSSSSSSESSSGSGSSSVLKVGSSGSAVKSLQQKLKKFGYFASAPTGLFGSITEVAVRDFQRDHGLTADGVAGAATLAKINGYSSGSKSKSTTTTTSSSVKVTAGSTNITLRLGSGSKQVTILQNALRKLGYLNTASTGYYGSRTRSAVMAFQKANKLKADGVAGPKTLIKLYKSKASSKSSALKPASSSSSSGYATLRQGSTSDAVKKLQNKLIAKGYLKTAATGFYGSATTSAIIEFQRKNGLYADGVAGPKTQAKLYGTSSSASSSSSSSKKKEVELADWWTVVSKVYARGDTATVTDVKTGKSFRVKRRGGTNHADNEPLTADDTAVMKSIYGSWKWDRRAIWLDVDGRRFAASMNGMPHGGSSLPYNNFNGHFCIHTLNSRNHCRNSVDAKHQAATRYAYEAGQ